MSQTTDSTGDAARERANRICHCCRVMKADVNKAVEKGAETLDQVIGATGATLGCGGCYGDLIAAMNESLELKKLKTSGQMGLPF